MSIQEGGRFSPVDRIVSPGVFTRENDLSGIAQGVADIGGAIVAPFQKGPGFSPTLLRNVADLEAKFGIADGVYYGPYTAKEYLKERGLVTVCRVGGLTGYRQQYPFVIWATKGTWLRNLSAGTVNSGSSYIMPSGSATALYSQSVSVSGANLIFNSASIVVTFTDTPLDADAATGEVGSSGSILYSSQTVTLGTSTLTVATQSTNIYSGTGSVPNYSVYDLVLSGSLSGTFTNPTTLTLVDDSSPFDSGIKLYRGAFYVETGSCPGNYVFHLKGMVSGTFGRYNGSFTHGASTFNVCENSWSSATPDQRVLAVLADTQYGGINSSLVAPGFSGSLLDYSGSAVTGVQGVLNGYRLENNGNSISNNFVMRVKSTDSVVSYGDYVFSMDASSTKYITSVFGNNPQAGDPDKQVSGQKIEAGYLYKVFENAIAEVIASNDEWFISGSWLPNARNFLGEPMKFTDDYSLNLAAGDSVYALRQAETPWIVSQQIASWDGTTTPTRFRMFKVHTLSDGTYTNKEYKIEVSRVKLAGTVAGSDWGSFTLTLRKFSDTDRRPEIMEQFNNLNLDPDSSNYIARRIGDRYNYINFNGKILEYGTFSNNSKHIRIEMNDATLPVAAVPAGFEAYVTPINSSIGRWTPVMKYTKASVYGLNPGKYPSGITFDDAPTGADAELLSLYPTSSTGVGAAEDNKQYMAPLPEFGAYTSVGGNVVFALDSDYRSYGVGIGSYLSASNAVSYEYDAAKEVTYAKMRKFVLGFQEGFDGQSPAIDVKVGGDIIPGNTQGMDCTNSTAAGSIAYKQAVACLGNADEFDINLIVAPGILHQHHPYVTTLIVDMCEARGDCFYILDLYSDDGNPGAGQVDEVISYASSYDTNYAATYYPWIKILDTNLNKIVTVPPSVVIPSVYAANDKVAAEWFAPAGLNRGGISIATQVTDRTTHTERDDLYEGKVNPIAAFPGAGIVVWGQKTLQDKASALDRVSVRRLLINLKKFIASTSKYLVFEQNTASTRNKFLSIVNPYLESVQQRSGLYAFFVKMDEENNTPDIIDQNTLYGQIYLKPTKTAEFIVLDFNILATGAAFPNA